MALIEDNQPPSSQTLEQTKSQSYTGKIKTTIQSRIQILAQHLVKLQSFHQRWSYASEVGKNWARSFLFGNQFLPHFLMALLALTVLTINIQEKIEVRAFYEQLVYVDPNDKVLAAESLDPYTGLISDDALLVEKSFQVAGAEDGFVNTVGSVATAITNREEPLPDNSTQTVDYIVREGDTLTGIGWKFEVKLATLKFVNDIENANAPIKPGAKLKVPARGYEVPASQIAKKEKEKQAKQAKLAAAKRTTITRNSARAATSSADYNGGGSGDLRVPLSHNGITRGLGRGHTGIDYRANVGTPIYAASSGKVTLADSSGWNGGYGIQVVLDHGSGVATRYAHLSSIAVGAGQYVNAGDIIAYSGNSGRSTGPHLHFEKIINGRPVNPF